MWAAAQSQIYKELRRMKELGWVEMVEKTYLRWLYEALEEIEGKQELPQDDNGTAPYSDMRKS